MTDMTQNLTRRKALKYAGIAGATGMTGCLNGGDGEDESPDVEEFLGSTPPSGRPEPGGTSVEELPDLSGSLTVYSGRGEPLVGDLMSYIDSLYEDFDLTPVYGASSDLSNQIIVEGENSPADVFYTVNVGALGALGNEGRTLTLSDGTVEEVREEFRAPDESWVGTSGRARTVPYNTEEFDGEELPEDIFGFPEDERFEGSMGWAPTYGSFQDFVTAMRILNSEEETRSWLEGMVESGIEEYPNEQVISNAVANGEIAAGFANHYYIRRTLDGNPEAPLDTHFTDGDAGSLFNVAGAAVIDTTTAEETANGFVRHLLSSEAQEFFAVRTGEYPLIEGVEPLGDLPSLEDINPPELDLTQLADVEPTLELLREVGVL